MSGQRGKILPVYRHPELERAIRFLLLLSFVWLTVTYLYFGWEPNALSMTLLGAPLLFVSFLLFCRSKLDRTLVNTLEKRLDLKVQRGLHFDRIEKIDVWERSGLSILQPFRWRLGIQIQKMGEVKFPISDFISRKEAEKFLTFLEKALF